jgi:hypothetical protein
MSLKDKRSLYDLVGGLGNNAQGGQDPVSANNDAFPSTLDYYTDEGNIGAPYTDVQANAYSADHLKSLLIKKQQSKATAEVYPSNAYYKPNAEDQDLEGNDAGNKYFHGPGFANPVAYQGLQVGEQDLHKHLLTSTYTYNYGSPFGLANPAVIPGPSSNAGLDVSFSDMDGVTPSDGYNSNPPEPGAFMGTSIT